ncbi:hypothetical protein [Paenibacillus lutimineralis]|uniref:Uncharacterized protein n=1 Tax=Paenibacillus lutimineralis TaxID=2707005 RepID=A0A3Q9I813_9BACL|nr:hypothetical protein [Paenibacillus lutimineralis]AZS14575.1 hypothetical protein EI981_09000 [Paenibacillus lutimineralis]
MNKWLCYTRSIEYGGSIIKATEDGGASVPTTLNGNGYSIDGNGAIVQNGHLVAGGMILSGNVVRGMATSGGGGTYPTSEGGSHDHGGTAGSHNHGNEANKNYAPPITRDGQHLHSVTIPPHEHDVLSHSHFIDHTHEVVIPKHSHLVNIPPHTHDMVFGIFKGPTPSKVEVRVDGNLIPGLTTSVDGFDIIPYLSKDDSGKVQRGWHEIEITPVNSLGRIVASVFSQVFATSRGGGNY